MQRLLRSPLFPFYLLFGVLVSMLGPLTHSTIDKLSDKTSSDEIYELQSAIVGANGDLIVCVSGTFGGKEADYQFSVDVHRMLARAKSRAKRSNNSSSFITPSWKVPPAESILGSCDESLRADSRSFPVYYMDGSNRLVYFHGSLVSSEFDSNVAADVREAVFVLEMRSDDETSPVTLFYAFRDDSRESSFAVPFGLAGYTVHGSRWWLAVLPFAWVADVLLWPIAIMMWVSYAGSH